MAKKKKLSLYCVQIVKPSGEEKINEMREVYIVAYSHKHALEQLEAVRNDGCTFQLDKRGSTLEGFGPIDPTKSKVYH